MPLYPHDPRAFNDWYGVDGESLAEYEAAILRSDEISTFRLAASKALISDDVVDADLWLSLRGETRGENGEIPEIDWGIGR